MGNYFSNVDIDKSNKSNKINTFNRYKNEQYHININNVNTYIPKLSTIKE
jgi:hypothetical protein